MDAPERGAMMLVRFIAVALILFSVAEIAATVAVQAVPGHAAGATSTVGNVLSFGLKSLPGLAGIVILIKARAIAEWLADLLDT
jgi:hypothetical protein